MPLNTVYLPKVDGLQTETSNINSDPRSLVDCIDVISNREDFLEARHGHPSVTKCTRVTGTLSDLYAYRSQTLKFFVPTYKVTGDSKYRFKTISQAGEEITNTSNESALRMIDNIDTTRSSQVNIKPTAFAHDERLLFVTDYGLYFTSYSFAGSSDAAKVDFPIIRSATVTPEWVATVSPTTDLQEENRHWLVSGFQTNIKIVFEIEAKEGNKGERRLSSPTSRIYEVKNFNLTNNATSTRTSNMLVRLSNVVLSHVRPEHSVYMKIYRTKQFQIGLSPEVEYYLATEEIKLSNTTPANLELTANDDIIVNTEILYNSPSQGGVAVTNHTPIPAKNVTQFRNYYLYSNLSLPTITSLGIKTMPVNNDTLTIQLSGTSIDVNKTITFKSSGATGIDQVNIPANRATLTSAYIADTDDLTFQGKRASEALDVRVRIVPGSGQGQVEPYGKITKVQFVNKNGNNAVVRVTSDASGFDINKFKQPGVAAIVDGNGIIKVLFSYSNYKRVASSVGFIDFEGSVSVGAAMPADITATLYMYSLNAENLETTTSNLDLFRGLNTGTEYLSLLPCKNGLTYPVAKPAPVSGILFQYLPTGTLDLQVNPEYSGLLTKPQGKLFDDLAVAIADNLQNQLNTTGAVISLSGGDRVESGVVNAEILDYRYEKIEFRRSVGSANAYEPPIVASTSAWTELAVSEKSISSFVVSKENNPELLPYSGINTPFVAGPYVPPKVGDPNKAIVATAATKDAIYLLKEDGVARVVLGFGTLVPTIEGINVFDNTTFCVASNSVQVLNDSVLFLAQNGVHVISGNSIQNISRSIETELKKAISRCRAADKLEDVRSFSNSAKGLYGLHIPLDGTNYVTYVLNIQTMRWTKWSNAFKGAVVDLDGRLTTLVGDFDDNYMRQDKYTNGDPRAEVDQIDDQFSLNSLLSITTGLERRILGSINSVGIGRLASRFGLKQVYYKSGSTLYLVSVLIANTTEIIITFQSAPPAFQDSDVLMAGVNMSLEFQPFTANNPSSLKMFSGFHTHTEESVIDLKVSFRTEARSTYSVVKKFAVSPDNRTVYRCYIPLESARGRFLYRKIEHTRPFQICAIPAQAIIFRDTGSERVQKSQ